MCHFPSDSLLPREAMPPPPDAWSEMPQCSPAPEGINSLTLQEDPSTVGPCPRPQKPVKAFPIHQGQLPLASPGFPLPQQNSLLSRRLMSQARTQLTSNRFSLNGQCSYGLNFDWYSPLKAVLEPTPFLSWKSLTLLRQKFKHEQTSELMFQ